MESFSLTSHSDMWIMFMKMTLEKEIHYALIDLFYFCLLHMFLRRKLKKEALSALLLQKYYKVYIFPMYEWCLSNNILKLQRVLWINEFIRAWKVSGKTRRVYNRLSSKLQIFSSKLLATFCNKPISINPLA